MLIHRWTNDGESIRFAIHFQFDSKAIFIFFVNQKRVWCTSIYSTDIRFSLRITMYCSGVGSLYIKDVWDLKSIFSTVDGCLGCRPVEVLGVGKASSTHRTVGESVVWVNEEVTSERARWAESSSTHRAHVTLTATHRRCVLLMTRARGSEREREIDFHQFHQHRSFI